MFQRLSLLFSICFLLIALQTKAQEITPVLIQTIDVTGEDVAWSPNGRYLAVTNSVQGIELFETSDFGLQAESFPLESNSVTALAFSPDSNLLAYGTLLGSITLRSLTDGNERVLRGHDDEVNDLIFSADGTILASSSEDNTTRLWDVASGLPRVLADHTDATWSAAFNDDGSRLMTSAADEELRLWDVTTGMRLAVLEGHSGRFDEVRSVVLRPGTQVFVSGSTDDTIRLWDGNQDGRNIGVIDTDSRGVTALAFYPTGSLLAVGTEDGDIQIVDFDAQSVRTSIPGPGGSVENIAFSPDGQFLAVASSNGVIIWGGFEPVTSNAQSVSTSSLALSPTASLTVVPSSTVTSVASATSTGVPSATAVIDQSLEAAAQLPIVAAVASSGTNSRSCPSTNCQVVQVVDLQDSLLVLGEVDGWFLVRLPNGQTSYIRSDLVVLPDDAVVPPAPTSTPTRLPSSTPRATSTPRSTMTPRPTNQPSASTTSQQDREDAQYIADVLFILAGGRDVEQVIVVDGRRNGGERSVLISYLSSAETEVELADEFVDIFSAVAAAISSGDIDLDGAQLVVGDAFGLTIGHVAVSINDLSAFQLGQITRGQFLSRLTITSF